MKSFKTIISAGFLASALVLAGCGGGSEMSDDMGMSEDMEMAKTDAMTAITAANTAANRLTNESDETAVMAARNAITAAVRAIDALDDADQAKYTVMLASAENTVSHHEGRLAEAKRNAADDADEEAKAEAEEAHSAAQTLHAALKAALESGDFDVSNTRSAAYLRAREDSSGVQKVSVTGKAFDKQYEDYIRDGKVYLAAADSDTDGSQTVRSSRAKAGDFGTSGTVTHDDFVSVSGGHEVYITGTYHGVQGRFTCMVAARGDNTCTSTFGNDGTLSLGGAGTQTWTFVPTSKTAAVDDGATVEYGWWLDDLGKSTHEARAFYGGANGSAVVTSFSGASATGGGSATYKGSAVGQYAISSSQDDSESGKFVANAELKATFGVRTRARIHGMIDGFKVGENAESRDWTVELVSQTIHGGETGDTDNPIDSAAAAGTFRPTVDEDMPFVSGTSGPRIDTAPSGTGMTVWTMNDDKGNASGNWHGALYGSTATQTETPAAVAGAFSATHGNTANMIGAFGAELDK